MWPHLRLRAKFLRRFFTPSFLSSGERLRCGSRSTTSTVLTRRSWRSCTGPRRRNTINLLLVYPPGNKRHVWHLVTMWHVRHLWHVRKLWLVRHLWREWHVWHVWHVRSCWYCQEDGWAQEQGGEGSDQSAGGGAGLRPLPHRLPAQPVDSLPRPATPRGHRRQAAAHTEDGEVDIKQHTCKLQSTKCIKGLKNLISHFWCWKSFENQKLQSLI